MKGRCGLNESELQVFWVDRAYALKMLFVKVTPSGARRGGADSGWMWAEAGPRFPHPEAAGAVDARLPRSAGKSQHVQGTGGDVAAEQGPVCLRLLREDPF